MQITLRIVAAAVFGRVQDPTTSTKEDDQKKPYLFLFNDVPVFESGQALAIGPAYDLLPG